MLPKWREQEKKEENGLLWHKSTCFSILTWPRKKCSSACRLISQHSLYPNSFGQALWNRNLCLRSHRSCFDRGSLLNVANDDRESCTRGPSRFASRATLHIHIFQSRNPQLSTFKPSSSSSSHGSFMTLHLFRITYRESYPPWGKLVWRELSIMLYKRASSHISPGVSWAPLPWPLHMCSVFPSLLGWASSEKFPGFCFPCRFPMQIV